MYLNLIQIAESFGVSERVVEDWIRNEGLPHVPDRGRLLFDRARVLHWAAAHGLTARAGFLASESGAMPTGLALEPMLRAGGIWRDVAASAVEETLERVLARLPRLSPAWRELLSKWVRAKGGINWAPVGGGVALPHFSTRVTLGRDAGVIALLLLREPLTWELTTIDEVPVTRLFFFIPPFPRAHLETLGRLSRAIARGPLGKVVNGGTSDEAIMKMMADADAEWRAESRRAMGG